MRPSRIWIAYFQTIGQLARNIAMGDIREQFVPRAETDSHGKAFQEMIAYLQKLCRWRPRLPAAIFNKT
jgi:hypothetical protein